MKIPNVCVNKFPNDCRLDTEIWIGYDTRELNVHPYVMHVMTTPLIAAAGTNRFTGGRDLPDK